MKYYLIDIETYNDGTKGSKAIYEYDTEDEAIANFHSKMGVVMKNVKCATVLCIVINSVGGVYANENWERKQGSAE